MENVWAVDWMMRYRVWLAVAYRLSRLLVELALVVAFRGLVALGSMMVGLRLTCH